LKTIWKAFACVFPFLSNSSTVPQVFTFLNYSDFLIVLTFVFLQHNVAQCLWDHEERISALPRHAHILCLVDLMGHLYLIQLLMLLECNEVQ
jgi:hypothetical protein